jgi:hypothetical protein
VSDPDGVHDRLDALDTAVTWVRDEVETSLPRLREGVATAREDAAAARALAAAAHAEAGDNGAVLRAHTQALNALRATQVEQGHTLQGLSETVGALVLGQDRHEEILSQHTETLDRHTESLNGLVNGQARLEQAVADIAATVHRLADRA